MKYTKEEILSKVDHTLLKPAFNISSVRPIFDNSKITSPCLNLQLFQQFFLTETSTSHFFSANNLVSKSHLLFLQFYNILFYCSLGN